MSLINEVHAELIKRELRNILKSISNLEVTKLSLNRWGEICLSRKLEKIIKDLESFEIDCLKSLGEEIE